MVTGRPDVNDTPYIGAVVLYLVLHNRLPGVEHDDDPELEGRRWGWNSDIKLRPVIIIDYFFVWKVDSHLLNGGTRSLWKLFMAGELGVIGGFVKSNQSLSSFHRVD